MPTRTFVRAAAAEALRTISESPYGQAALVAARRRKSWYTSRVPSEDQHRVSQIVISEVERRTRADDGWCWAWASALTFVSSSQGVWFEGAIFFDRDVVDEV